MPEYVTHETAEAVSRVDGRAHFLNARVIDPATGTDARMDLWVDSGGVHRTPPPDGTTYVPVELDGAVVAPAFVEIHAHLRQPGGEESETVATGLAAAREGGYGNVLAMANTRPTNDDPEITRLMLRAAREADTGVRLHPVSAVSRGLEGREPAPWAAQVAAGCVALSDDGRPVADHALLEEALAAGLELGVPYLSHAECPELFNGVVHDGVPARHLGIAGIPVECESLAVEREIAVAERLGAPLHICHISTARAIEAVRRAASRGVRVSAEVTPHHLALTDEAFLARGRDTHLKMNPPLRTGADVVASREALRDGTVCAVATDHAPHAPALKRRPLERAPFGVIGMENAFATLHELLVRGAGWPLALLVDRFTRGPADVVGLPAGRLFEGPTALVVLDAEAPWTIAPDRFLSRSRNCPFAGLTGRGRVIATLLAGRLERCDGLSATPR